MENIEYYEIIPEFNAAGRLCNYHTGEAPPDGEIPPAGGTVKVSAEEWERFNLLAGRQHEIVNGMVTFNPDLEPCGTEDKPLDMDELKQSKQRELSAACEASIYAGFTHNNTLYGYDAHDQQNMSDMALAAVNGLAPEIISWKGKGDAPYTAFTHGEFKALYAAALMHKQGNIMRYYELLAAVAAAETIEELDGILWGV